MVMVRFELPDLLHVTYIGHLDGPQILAAAQEARELIADRSSILMLINVAQVSSFSAAARRAAADTKEGERVRGLAIVGASFHQKVIGSLVVRAAQLIRRNVEYPVRFCETENEARVWFDARRRECATPREKSSKHQRSW